MQNESLIPKKVLSKHCLIINIVEKDLNYVKESMILVAPCIIIYSDIL